MTEASAPPAPSSPRWKNPYLLGFVLGALALTALPWMQRGCLRAPPPLAQLAPWQGRSMRDGAPMGTAELAGSVWVASFPPSPCDAACEKAQERFAGILRHVDDLQAPIHLITFTRAGDPAPPKTPEGAGARWHLVEVDAVPGAFDEAWGKFSHPDAATPGELQAFALVDQNGGVRGFWPAGDPGRGNLINAARMLAKYGPAP